MIGPSHPFNNSTERYTDLCVIDKSAEMLDRVKRRRHVPNKDQQCRQGASPEQDFGTSDFARRVNDTFSIVTESSSSSGDDGSQTGFTHLTTFLVRNQRPLISLPAVDSRRHTHPFLIFKGSGIRRSGCNNASSFFLSVHDHRRDRLFESTSSKCVWPPSE